MQVGIGKSTTALEITPNQKPLRFSTLLDSQPTNVDVTDGATNEVVYTKTIEANTLGVDGVLRVTVIGNAPVPASETSMTVAVVFGGTTFYTTPNLVLYDGGGTDFKIFVEIFNRDATGSQFAGCTTIRADSDDATVALNVLAKYETTGTVDTTVDQTLQVTASESGDSGGANPIIRCVLVEQL